jgi:hypothetical protein
MQWQAPQGFIVGPEVMIVPDEESQLGSEGAAEAAVAHAGEPHGSSATRELTPDEGAPTPEELDAREEYFRPDSASNSMK